MIEYPKDHPTDATISVFEHRSGDCPIHGDNRPFARLKRGLLGEIEYDPRFKCIACMLEAAEPWLGFGT